MKRRDLVKAIVEAGGVLKREGAGHSIFTVNGRNVSVPRHAEINEITAKSILKQIQDEGGQSDG